MPIPLLVLSTFLSIVISIVVFLASHNRLRNFCIFSGVVAAILTFVGALSEAAEIHTAVLVSLLLGSLTLTASLWFVEYCDKVPE